VGVDGRAADEVLLERQVVAQGVEHLDGGSRDLGPDAVARQGDDLLRHAVRAPW
jgi:hypothetical protein